MQHLFSWMQYLLFSITLLALYYAIVIFKFYRKELFQARFNKGKINTTSSEVRTLLNEKASKTTAEAVKDNLTSTVHEFVYELKTLLQQLIAQKEEKAAIMKAAVKLINKYQTLKGSQFQPGLVNLIAAETETICGIRLNTDELISLWQ